MNNSKMPAFSVPSIKAMAQTFPYQDKSGPMSRDDYKLLAKTQRSVESRRRTAFLERFNSYMLSNDSVRSFPTPSFTLPDVPVMAFDEETQTSIELLPVRSMRPASRSEPVVSQVVSSRATNEQVEPSSTDEYPFDLPPIDPSQYAGVDVDEAYDTTGPVAPSGHDGQPDIHDWSGATEGSVTTLGRYPYLYKEGESKTFMVRVGTKDHWGVDLERVVREFNIKKGDKIALMCIGKQDVIVPKKVRQDDGSIKTEEINAVRNTWVAKRVK
jgi:hypothetical protein